MMRMKSRYVRVLGLLILLLVVLFVMHSQMADPTYEDAPPRGQSPADSSLDELLDESFTRPPDNTSNIYRVDVGRLPSGILNFGVVEKRSSPLCPAGALESPVSARVRAFQPLISGGDELSPLFIYSASARLVFKALRVELWGLAEPNFRAALFCQLWYRAGPRPLSLLPARIVALPESRVTGSPSALRAVVVECTESDVSAEDRAPYAVSLVAAARLCDSPEMVLPLIGGPATAGETGARSGRQGVAVCSPTPVQEAEERAQWLLEWLEAQRVLGAQRVYLYRIPGVDNGLSRLLAAYTRPGASLVSLLDWPLPSGVTVNNNARTLALNDCLRRAAAANMARVLVADFRKLLVPGSRFADWPALVAEADADALLIQSAKTAVAGADEREAMGGSPLRISVRQRSSRLSPPGEDANVLVDPYSVDTIGGDGQIQFRTGSSGRRMRVTSDDALVFDFQPRLEGDEDLVIDERMAPFTFRLMAAVKTAQIAVRH